MANSARTTPRAATGLRVTSGLLSAAADRNVRAPGARGFTLIELMVVMVIIGILASIAVPALKGLGQANRSSAAHRQMLEDLGFARLKAINDRTTVYMVFAPPNVRDALAPSIPRTVNERRQLTNLLSGQFSAYALVSTRTVGDQPGRPTPRYLTEWKTLPEGLIFAPYKLLATSANSANAANEYDRTYNVRLLPFPSSRGALFNLPSIGFNAQGQLISSRDEVVTLAKGSVFLPRNKDGTPAPGPLDVQMNPEPNRNKPAMTQTNTYQFVRINWLTGRAKVEIPEIQ